MNVRSGIQPRRLAGAALLYVALTVALTWPATPRLSREVAGLPARDNLQYTWLLWWQGAAWRQGLSAGDNLLNYPWHPAHPLLGITPELEALALPLQGILSSTEVYNLILLLSFPLCGLAMYLLLMDITNNDAAAMLGGAIFAFFPHRLGHALAGHLTQLALWWGPLYLRHMLRLFDRARWRDALWAGLFLGLQGLVALVVTAYFALPLAAVVLTYLLWTRRRWLTWPLGLRLAASLLLSVAIVMPLLGAFVVDAVRHGADFRISGVTPNAVDLLALALPTPFHPLWGRAVNLLRPVQLLFRGASDLEHTAYLGWVALALAGVGVARRGRECWLWVFLSLLTLVLALGPTLRVGGADTGLPMPYAFLERLPFMSWGRTPERFLALTLFGLSALAAQGFAALRWPTIAKGAILALLLAEMLVTWPWPAGTPRPPEEMVIWRGEPGAVAQFPAAKRQVSNLGMYHQTVHERPMVGGYIHRELPGMREYAKALDAACLEQAPGAARTLTARELRYLLAGLDIRHALLYRDWVSSTAFAAAEARFNQAFGEPIADWGFAVVYDVPPDAPGTEPLARWASIVLLSAEVVPRRMQPGEVVTISTFWQTTDTPAANLTLFAHLLDEDLDRGAQEDGPPLGGNWPTTLWAPASRVLDQRSVVLPEDLPSGAYSLGLGWYDAITQQRWPLLSAGETQADMAILRVALEVE